MNRFLFLKAIKIFWCSTNIWRKVIFSLKNSHSSFGCSFLSFCLKKWRNPSSGSFISLSNNLTEWLELRIPWNTHWFHNHIEFLLCDVWYLLLLEIHIFWSVCCCRWWSWMCYKIPQCNRNWLSWELMRRRKTKMNWSILSEYKMLCLVCANEMLTAKSTPYLQYFSQ